MFRPVVRWFFSASVIQRDQSVGEAELVLSFAESFRAARQLTEAALNLPAGRVESLYEGGQCRPESQEFLPKQLWYVCMADNGGRETSAAGPLSAETRLERRRRGLGAGQIGQQVATQGCRVGMVPLRSRILCRSGGESRLSFDCARCRLSSERACTRNSAGTAPTTVLPSTHDAARGTDAK